MAAEFSDQAASTGVPELWHIATADQHLATIGRNRHGGQRRVPALNLPDGSPGPGVPEPCRAVPTSCQEEAAVA